MTAGELLRLFRQRKQLTLRQLAIGVGCSHVHLSRCEAGINTISVDLAHRAIALLGIPRNEMIDAMFADAERRARDTLQQQLQAYRRLHRTDEEKTT